MLRFFIFLISLHISWAFIHGLFGGKDDYSILGILKPADRWDGLSVTWSDSAHGNASFDQLPRTESAAQSEGYTMLSNCGDTLHFAGKRYCKDDDKAVVLLYDINGYIAGIQAGIPDSQLNGYPKEPLQHHPFVLYEDTYYITAYFVPPNQICSVGRTQAMFDRDGTGKDLFIQNGTSPCQVLRIPHFEDDIIPTKWGAGKCFPSMGMRYFYNVRKDMDCDEFFPVFLLYNNGKLNAFGWAFDTILPSVRYEHPPNSFFGAFLDPVPDCLHANDTESGLPVHQVSTMHIYLTEHYMLNWC